MTRSELVRQIFAKKSFLCVGLDTDSNRLPECLAGEGEPEFQFNKAIIDATLEHCVAYKLNTAFYEAGGTRGWMGLKKTIDYIPDSHFVILDAKRGDIGNTAHQYALMAFEDLQSDAITVAPYMGRDSVDPFIAYTDRWTILLALTSNPSCIDFEMKKLANGNFLFEEVLIQAQTWAGVDQLMFVVGATRSAQLRHIRSLAPQSFFLVPGVGAQGGNLEDVIRSCWIEDCGILVNSSRSIIYSSDGSDFAIAAGRVAASLAERMQAAF